MQISPIPTCIAAKPFARASSRSAWRRSFSRSSDGSRSVTRKLKGSLQATRTASRERMPTAKTCCFLLGPCTPGHASSCLRRSLP
jgi:hypothetical protein